MDFRGRGGDWIGWLLVWDEGRVKRMLGWMNDSRVETSRRKAVIGNNDR